MDILRYAGRRLLQTVPVLFGITLIAFFMLRLIPGDPAAQMLGARAATQENIAIVRHQLGLDQPLVLQYLHFLEGSVRGDLGQSFFYKQPVLPLVVERVPVSVGLVVYAVADLSLPDLSRGIDCGPEQGSTGRSPDPRHLPGDAGDAVILGRVDADADLLDQARASSRSLARARIWSRVCASSFFPPSRSALPCRRC